MQSKQVRPSSYRPPKTKYLSAHTQQSSQTNQDNGSVTPYTTVKSDHQDIGQWTINSEKWTVYAEKSRPTRTINVSPYKAVKWTMG